MDPATRHKRRRNTASIMLISREKIFELQGVVSTNHQKNGPGGRFPYHIGRGGSA